MLTIYSSSSLETTMPYLIIGIAAVAIIVLGILIYVAVSQKLISDYFASKKFNVRSKHKIEPLTGEQKFEIHVFNNNVNDARILSFGFLYRSNSIDFLKSYRNFKKIGDEEKVIILSRDFISLEIEAQILQDLVNKHNDHKLRVKKIFAYVTDNSGNIIKYNAREVRKIIQRHFKALDDDKKHEMKLARKAKRKENCQARKEGWANRRKKIKQFFVNIKQKFNQNKKNTSTSKSMDKPSKPVDKPKEAVQKTEEKE
jgi:hypothetical protein